MRCAELECFCTPKSAVRPPAPARTTAESWGAVLEGSFVIPSRSRCAPHKKLISKGKRTLQQRFAIGIAASLHARRLRSLRSANFPAGSVSAALVVKHRGRQANPNSPGPREPARAAHPSRGLRASGLSAYEQADCVKRIASKRGLRAADVVLPAEVYKTDRGAAFVLARARPLAEPLRAARRAAELEARPRTTARQGPAAGAAHRPEDGGRGAGARAAPRPRRRPRRLAGAAAACERPARSRPRRARRRRASPTSPRRCGASAPTSPTRATRTCARSTTAAAARPAARRRPSARRAASRRARGGH